LILIAAPSLVVIRQAESSASSEWPPMLGAFRLGKESNEACDGVDGTQG
jgi:hypothetical protein